MSGYCACSKTTDSLDLVVVLAVSWRLCSLMPALAYTVDMRERTDGMYGVNETQVLHQRIAHSCRNIF